MIKKSKFRNSAEKEVIRTLKGRIKNGTLESEPDFLAGAMTVLLEVNRHFYGVTDEEKVMGIVSPNWIFSPMMGESILDK